MSPKDIHLTEEEIDALLTPIEDHGDCWGAIAWSILDGALRSKRAKLEQKQAACVHKWEYPVNHGFRGKLQFPKAYCKLCFKDKERTTYI